MWYLFLLARETCFHANVWWRTLFTHYLTYRVYRASVVRYCELSFMWLLTLLCQYRKYGINKWFPKNILFNVLIPVLLVIYVKGLLIGEKWLAQFSFSFHFQFSFQFFCKIFLIKRNFWKLNWMREISLIFQKEKKVRKEILRS